MPKLSLANNGSCVEYDGPAAAERLHTCFAQQRLEETVTALVIFFFPIYGLTTHLTWVSVSV